MAWFKRNQRRNGTESQESRAGDSSATDGGFGQRDSQHYTETVGPPKITDGGSEEEVAQYDNLGGAPEDLRVPFVPLGSPRGEEGMPHLEKATDGLAGPFPSQGAAVAPKPYKCPGCGDRFRLKGLFRIHHMVSLRKPSLPCPECGVCFPTGWHLERHQRRIHKWASADRGGAGSLDGWHCCADCGKSFHWYVSFLQHQKTHEEVKAWLCAQCGAAFMYRSDLALHEESHFEEALCVPSPCGENCVCRLSFLLHCASQPEKSAEKDETDSQGDEQLPWEGKNEREKPHLCHRCEERFSSEENLKKHYRYCYIKQPQQHRRSTFPPGDQKEGDKQLRNRSVPTARRNRASPPLQRSSAGFPSRDSLCKHRQRHKAEDRRSATELNKSVSPANGRGSHAPVGIAKKLHKCRECGKRFVFKRELAAHVKSHAKESRCRCTFCGESLGYTDRFGKQLRIHAGERAPRGQRPADSRVPSVTAAPSSQGEKKLCRCDECGKSLKKSYFPDHLAWHRGVRFSCLLCGHLSNFNSAAHRHLQRHRKRRDFSTCPRCGETSQSKRCLCMIERIDPGQKPLPALYHWEGASQPANDSGGRRPPQTAHPLGNKAGPIGGERKERSPAAGART